MKRVVECFIFGVALLVGCTEKGNDAAGATSETTNGIAIVAFDGAHKPIPQARVTLYQRSGAVPVESPSEDITQFLPSHVSALETATADDSGMVQFGTELDQCQNARCYVEGIAGEDSSLMVWTKLDAVDSTADEIELLPSVTLTVRTGAAASDSIVSRSVVMLDATPYWAKNDGSEFVFSHVDFDDGDSLNNLAKTYKNFGWYYMPHKGAVFESPDSASGFAGALVDDGAGGKYLSLKYAIQDTGYVMLGTHLGLDSGYYDLSALSAVRLKVRGDCDFAVALEHYRQIENNNYNKALWMVSANDEWTDLVLHPGKEVLDSENYQVSWGEISNEIGIFSIFIYNGTRLEIDEIVFEGIQIID